MIYSIKERRLGALAVAFTAILWSSAGILIKLIDWNPFFISCGRSLCATIFLLFFIKKSNFTFSFPQIGAAVCSALTMLLFVYANKTTSAANAILLQYGAPIYTALLGGLILKEKPRLEHYLAFVVIIIGMILFFVGDIGGGSIKGDIVAILSGITFGFYFVFLRMQKDGSPLESNFLAHVIVVVFGLIIGLGLEKPVFTVKSCSAILVLGIFQVGLASVFLSWGVKRITAIQCSLLAGIEPVFNPVWVFLFLHETPSKTAMLGGLLIIVAVIVSSLISTKRSHKLKT